MQLQVINPFTGSVDRSYDFNDFEVVKNELSALKKHQIIWKQKSLQDRIVAVKSCLDYFEKNRELISDDISKQMGRPRQQAAGEISGLLERALYMCSIATDTLSDDSVEPKDGFQRSIIHEPFGVVFTIAAWNYPLLVAINSIVPALLSGNVVLLKHSGQTPEIGKHFERAFSSNLVKNVILTHETTGKIIESGIVDHVVFTGSVSGGKQILRHCAESLISPALELGGKDGVYVHSDADLQAAAESIVDGAMFNSGQSCCGTERVYVHEKIYDEFLSLSEKLIATYKLGDPQQAATNMGPVFKATAVELMTAQVEEAVEKGAKVILGGKKQTIDSAVFFQPTLISQVDHCMQVMQEENFGPIMPVMKVSGFDEAVGLINDSKYGLTAAIFTKSKELAESFSDAVEAGTIFMNRCDYLDPALPWTGYKNSGSGSSLSKYGFYSLTQLKSLNFKVKDQI